MNPTNTLAFALITTLTGSIGAQDPIPLARPDRIPIHELQIDRQPAQIWGAGRDYKVSFHDGMNFVPYLGHDYPVNQPFGWTTTSVRIGEVELLTGSPPRLTTSDFRAELDLGVVVEAYDLLPQGLEQTFVLPRRPLAAGPLVVTGALATRLTPRVSEPGHGALTFVDGHDRAILTYGAATAVDADGRRFAMTTRCVAGTIELALDAVAVANARFPLTVDPLLGPATTYTANMNYWSVDCENATAEGTPSHRVLHAFSFESSATDADIVCYTYSSSYFGSAPVFSDLSLESTPRVACGYVAATNRWVIVYEALTQSIRRLRAHVRTVDDMSVGTIVNSLSTPAGLHDWRPDVGGTMFNGNTKALVVFQRESLAGSFADTTTSSVMGVMLETGSAFGTWNTPFQISAAGNYDSERPSVAQQAEGSSNGFWMCAYQEFNNTLAGDDFDVVARRVGAGGTVQPGQWRSDFDNLNPAWHQLSPIVAGYEGRYAVLFTVVPVATQPHPTFDFGSELRLECFDWYEGQPLPNPTYDHPPIQLQATAQLELIPTGLSFDTQSRSHWAATWLRNAPTGPQALAARCAHNGTVLEGPLTAFAATAGESVTAASVTFDRSNGRFRMLYTVAGLPTNGQTTAYARFLSHPGGAAIQHGGTGCGAATLDFSGPALGPYAYKNALIGTRGTYVAGLSPNPTDLHFLIAAFGTTSVPIVHPLVAPGCTQLVPTNQIGVLPLQIGGFPAWPVSVPLSMVGVTLSFQDWVYDPLVDQLSATDRVTVDFVR